MSDFFINDLETGVHSTLMKLTDTSMKDRKISVQIK